MVHENGWCISYFRYRQGWYDVYTPDAGYKLTTCAWSHWFWKVSVCTCHVEENMPNLMHPLGQNNINLPIPILRPTIIHNSHWPSLTILCYLKSSIWMHCFSSFITSKELINSKWPWMCFSFAWIKTYYDVSDTLLQGSWKSNHGDSTKSIWPGSNVMKSPKWSPMTMSKVPIFISTTKDHGANEKRPTSGKINDNNPCLTLMADVYLLMQVRIPISWRGIRLSFWLLSIISSHYYFPYC